jgi:hypothetical protein
MMVLMVGSILLSADSVRACSCITLPLLDNIKSSENIVLLQLKSVEKYKEDERVISDDGIKQSKLVVRKVFKGKLKVGQELIFNQGVCCICIWGFNEKSVGTEYLFFLDSNEYKDGLWEAYICSGSDSLKFAASNLLYLEKLNKVKGKTRLSGTVYKTKGRWNVEFYEPMAKAKIRLLGNGIDVTLTTDKSGVYEIYDLPVGKYELIPPKIKGFAVIESDRFTPPHTNIFEVEIKAKSLTEQDIKYLVD